MSQLAGSDWCCDKAFVVTGPHFKHKFCESCQAHGIQVSVNRIRALPENNMTNGNGVGVWTKVKAHQAGDNLAGVTPASVVGQKRPRNQCPGDTVFFRVVNHTARCEAPRLAIFEGKPAEGIPFDPLPPTWITADGSMVHLIIRKGTLVPAAEGQHHMPRFYQHVPQPSSMQSNPIQIQTDLAAPRLPSSLSAAPHLQFNLENGSHEHRYHQQLALDVTQHSSVLPPMAMPLPPGPNHPSPPPIHQVNHEASFGQPLHTASGWTQCGAIAPHLAQPPMAMPCSGALPACGWNAAGRAGVSVPVAIDVVEMPMELKPHCGNGGGFAGFPAVQQRQLAGGATRQQVNMSIVVERRPRLPP